MSKVTALLLKGIALQQQGQLLKAKAIYSQVLALQPTHFDALHLSGLIAAQSKNLALALELFGKAIKVKPDFAHAHSNLGNVLQELKQFEDALSSYDRAIEIKPDFVDAYFNRGIALKELNRNKEALASYEKAIEIKPDFAEVHSSRGNVLQNSKHFENALSSYDEAIRIKPHFAEAHYNRGIVLKELMRIGEAVVSYDMAIVIKPDYADAYCNRGIALHELKRFEEALISYDYAIEIKPDFADAHCNRGNALKELNRLEEAVVSYGRAIEIKPDYEYLLGTLLHTKMHICDWQDFDANAKNLLLKISEGKKSSPSFPILALTDSLSIQHKTAEIWINDNHPFNPSLDIISKLPRKEKIKLAFLSADFKEHPTGYNFVGFFENIDRDKFEVIAVSFLNITDSPLSRRLAAAFDVFKIVDKLSDTEVCKWVLDQKVDIAIDMMGPTLGNRGGILAMRCAPIQVNQFSWTSGAPYIDYNIADPISMPKEYAEAYSEKLAYVPHTLFATDDKREISIKTPLRSEQDLPEKGIVFCCLNNNFKITPHVFDSWINILKNVPDSVLWIKGGHESMERNLRGEVALRGVDTSRLVFAKHTALMQDHLARYRLADLFLDTFPFCAQTTASDALWAGVPVLTRVGESSMSRICASLLNAIELPELITKTQSEYEATAIELATNPVKLNAIKDKLARNRLTTALFDTPRFTKNIEAAYIQMYERYQDDFPAENIYIQD